MSPINTSPRPLLSRPNRAARRSGGVLFAGYSLVAVAAGATLLLGDLETHYEEARIFDVNVASTTSTETVKMEVMRDGEPVDFGGRRGGDRTQSFELTYSDTILGAADGAPTEVQRKFESVGGSMEFEGRDGSVERSMESEFEGLTLVLTQGDGEVDVQVTDGEAPDGERLEGHVMGLPLDGLLPEEAVEVGGEWEIEGKAFLNAMGLGVQSKLIDRPERGGGGEGRGRGNGGGGRRGRGGWQRGGGGADMLAKGEWDITATLADETREVDGVTCAVITIKAEVEGEPEGGGGREGSVVERSYEGDFEGELLFCVAESRPVSFDASGSYELSTDMSSESERGSMEMSRVEETELTVSVTVGARKASSDD